MRLSGMARSFKNILETEQQKNYTIDEVISQLVDCEYDDRYNRKMQRLLYAAKFRNQASIEAVDFTLNRNLDKNMFLRFSDCAWIGQYHNIIFTGPTGTGKSFLAQALGHQACILGYKVKYFNCTKLFKSLKLYHADGTYIKEIDSIANQDAIIFDDFGLELLDTQSRLSLLEIIEDRYGKKSTIISSQVPITKWHEIIGDSTIADAICDRLIHNSTKIQLKGDSVRKNIKKN